MNNNKKPGEPLETEGRVMEDEIQKLKRSSLILSVACFVQSLLLLRIVWQISDIYSTPRNPPGQLRERLRKHPESPQRPHSDS